jgi:hypothetical protein
MSEKETIDGTEAGTYIPDMGGHRWVPIEECGELAEGLYVATGRYGFRETIRLRDADKFEATHLLSPHLGPIPDAPGGGE